MQCHKRGRDASWCCHPDLEELATRELTAAEREQRAIEAASELGVEYTEQVEQAGQDAWAKIRAHQGSAAA
ncbi:hypothetical protein ABZ070_30020 [Streptomyces sp. NPDC006283]|uniref:hypothetical protein n=1 Tax=Streptomyces sp. NPDC006283 TaxID=3156741 RepID=UPI0033B1155F